MVVFGARAHVWKYSLVAGVAWLSDPNSTETRYQYYRHTPVKETELDRYPTMPDNLQIIVHSDKQGAVMYLQGRVSIETSPDFRHHLLATLRKPSPPEALAIDLAGVFYMDTSGIATLIQALKVARIAGTAMHLQGLQGRILHLFEATGVGSLFDDARAADNSSTTVVS
jgi:anti-sigma B factor antagonist